MDIKYLVQLTWFNSPPTPLVICDSRQQAKDWINSRLEDKEYSGLGIYTITEVEHI